MKLKEFLIKKQRYILLFLFLFGLFASARFFLKESSTKSDPAVQSSTSVENNFQNNTPTIAKEEHPQTPLEPVSEAPQSSQIINQVNLPIKKERPKPLSNSPAAEQIERKNASQASSQQVISNAQKKELKDDRPIVKQNIVHVNSPKQSLPEIINHPVPYCQNEDSVDHKINLFSNFRNSTLAVDDKTTGTSASFTSSIDFELGSSWQQNWTQNSSSYLQFSIRHVDFNEPVSSSKSLSNKNHTVTLLQIGGIYKSAYANLNYYFSHGGEFFVRGVSTSDVYIDPIALSHFGLDVDLPFFQKDLTDFGGSFSIQSILGTKTDAYIVNTGVRYGGSLYILKNSQDLSLKASIGFQNRVQNTSILEQSNSELYGAVIISFPIFNERKRKLD